MLGRQRLVDCVHMYVYMCVCVCVCMYVYRKTSAEVQEKLKNAREAEVG